MDNQLVVVDMVENLVVEDIVVGKTVGVFGLSAVFQAALVAGRFEVAPGILEPKDPPKIITVEIFAHLYLVCDIMTVTYRVGHWWLDRNGWG